MRAVVVGASRGIGAAIRHELEQVGRPRSYWCGRVVDVSRSAGRDVVGLNWDELFEQLGGDVELLVYCAGHVDVASLVDVTDEQWQYHLDVNLTGAHRALRAFARNRAGRPGVVVFVASTAALRPAPAWGAYSASKAALVNLALTAAVELAPVGIRVYCVAPGRCATHLRARLAPDEDPASIMQPEEVAAAVARLIADGNQDGVLAGQVVEVARR